MMSTTSNVLLAIGPPAPNVRIGRNAALTVMARSSPTRPRSPRELRDRAGELRDRHRPYSREFRDRQHLIVRTGPDNFTIFEARW